MLSAIRRKFTVLYTLVFGILLLAFIGIVCAGLIWGVYVERTDEIRVLVNEIAHEQSEEIIQHYKNHSAPQEIPQEDDYDISGQVFYYILDENRQLVKADPPVPVLREAAHNEITNWNTSKNAKIAVVTLTNGDTAMLALAEQEVYRGGAFLGTVYAGRDITAYFRVLLRSILTLAGATVIFLIIASLIGYFLAGRVTAPIEQMMNRQKQFVADASHELRNPLSVLLTSIEAIEMDNDTILSPYSERIVLNAKDEFFRLKRLVNDLLTLARADTGDIRLKMEIFSLEPIAKQVICSLKTAAEQKKINLLFHITEPLEIKGDPERIHQLFYILIDNAIKYSLPNSEVSVRIEKVQNGRPFAKIDVEDTGTGIPMEFQKQIFQRFFRVDESRSRHIEGSGLGLSIAQWIVEFHQGQISVHSEPGKGSQFTALIPIG